ncbi:MAG: ClbS/DfsB family four-helix bundle protein [Spirochaetes bacterium]|jgi:hypothetical protein|nr:ClbS/DfsB family four-helix bundle protein [Spirochaetota bacterium]
MSKFTTKQEFLEEIAKERAKLETLLESIPDDRKTEEVTDGMSVKDFLAHRAEWGAMMVRWYEDARAGKVPAVPTERFKWNQLKELNADIHTRFRATPLPEVVERFNRIHDELYRHSGSACGTAGFSVRSHYLDAVTFGGTTWLSDATLLTGLRIDK